MGLGERKGWDGVREMRWGEGDVMALGRWDGME